METTAPAHNMHAGLPLAGFCRLYEAQVRAELRYTFGTRAQDNGMPTLTLQHYMGHSSSKVTVTERYAHAAQSERLKRGRDYSPIDQLGLRVKQARLGGNRKR
jgi:hypothetical protein